ncbi:CGNR zinc finger domain-containing protein [Streptomyces seoulensis]|uniref:CGNR zinc finger domain-containing protein n=1 Tax=Streptomyces seoulensis TaxID=73044 RepID=UPI001F37C99D|nr:CGNR zinc finger domain-containing protein [Streptomyces seoulensis]
MSSISSPPAGQAWSGTQPAYPDTRDSGSPGPQQQRPRQGTRRERPRESGPYGEARDLQAGARGEDLTAQVIRGLPVPHGEQRRQLRPLPGADQQRGPDQRGRPPRRRQRQSGGLHQRAQPDHHVRRHHQTANTALAAATLNRLLHAHTGRLRLSSHDGTTPWHPHLDRADDAPWAEWFLASSCLALTVLLWDRRRPPGGTCASPSCGNVYVTQGSGPPRRYCSRRCATRERVAAHRRAKRESL